MINIHSFITKRCNAFNIKRIDIELPRHDLLSPFSLLDVLLRGMSSHSLLNVQAKTKISTKQPGISQWNSFNFAVSD